MHFYAVVFFYFCFYHLWALDFVEIFQLNMYMLLIIMESVDNKLAVIQRCCYLLILEIIVDWVKNKRFKMILIQVKYIMLAKLNRFHSEIYDKIRLGISIDYIKTKFEFNPKLRYAQFFKEEPDYPRIVTTNLHLLAHCLDPYFFLSKNFNFLSFPQFCLVIRN